MWLSVPVKLNPANRVYCVACLVSVACPAVITVPEEDVCGHVFDPAPSTVIPEIVEIPADQSHVPAGTFTVPPAEVAAIAVLTFATEHEAASVAWLTSTIIRSARTK